VSDIERIEQKVDAVLSAVQGGPARFLGIEAAAAYCGLSAKSIRRLIAAGKLTAHRPVRGKVLLDRQQLDALILNSTSTPRTGRGRA
jgi:excisionase family DNA binding protein